VHWVGDISFFVQRKLGNRSDLLAWQSNLCNKWGISMNIKRFPALVSFSFFIALLSSFAFAQENKPDTNSSNDLRMMAYPLSLPIGSQFRIDSSYVFSSGDFNVDLESSALLTLEGRTQDGHLIWRSDQGFTKVNKSEFKIQGFTENQSLALSTLMKTFLESAAALDLHIFSDTSGYPIDIVDAHAFSKKVQHVMMQVRSSEEVQQLYKDNFKDPETVMHSTLDAIFESLIKPDKNAFLATILSDYRDAFRFVGSDLLVDTDSVIDYTNYVEGFDNFFELATRLTMLNPDQKDEPVKLSFIESYSDAQLTKIKSAMADYMSQQQSQVTEEQFANAMDKVNRVKLMRTGEKHFDRESGMPVYIEISEVNNYFNAEEVSKSTMTFTPLETQVIASAK